MLAVVLSGLIKWPQTTIGPKNPPYKFLPNSVAIIDSTEIFIQHPSNLTTQKSSYSDYKSHNIVKYLLILLLVIASIRIRIENAIGRLKEYKILPILYPTVSTRKL